MSSERTVKKMRLSMHSAQYFLPFGDLFEDDGFDKSTIEKMFESTVGDPVLVKYKCEATYIESSDRCAVRYTEGKTEELSGASTVISFSKDMTGGVSIIRRFVGSPVISSNAENAVLVDPEHGYETKYRTEMGDFTLRCICGKIKNTIGEKGGTMLLDYITQLEGFDPQRIKMRIELKPLMEEVDDVE
ncbi:MAG: DUF1934 family protein [Ruminococcaceae bacterium]|nr:DUF1934 family protein [Oscillospiraceae bacterium]